MGVRDDCRPNVLLGAKKFTPFTPPFSSALASSDITPAVACHSVSLKLAACPIGIGKEVGQPLLWAEGAKQPLRIPWQASLNSNPGTLSRSTGAVRRWLMNVVPTRVSL